MAIQVGDWGSSPSEWKRRVRELHEQQLNAQAEMYQQTGQGEMDDPMMSEGQDISPTELAQLQAEEGYAQRSFAPGAEDPAPVGREALTARQQGQMGDAVTEALRSMARGLWSEGQARFRGQDDPSTREQVGAAHRRIAGEFDPIHAPTGGGGAALYEHGAYLGMTRQETIDMVQKGQTQGVVTNATSAKAFMTERTVGSDYEKYVTAFLSGGGEERKAGYLTPAQWRLLPPHRQARMAGMVPVSSLPKDDFNQPIVPQGYFRRGGEKHVYPWTSVTQASPLGMTPAGEVISTFQPSKVEKRIQMLGAHETMRLSNLRQAPAFMREGPASGQAGGLRQVVRGAFIIGGDVSGPGQGLIDVGGVASQRVTREITPKMMGGRQPNWMAMRGATFSPGTQMQLAGGMEGEETGKYRYTVQDVVPTKAGGYRYVMEREATINQARLAAKSGISKLQLMEADLSQVRGAGEGLQMLGGMKDIQGGIYEWYRAKGMGALAQDIAAHGREMPGGGRRERSPAAVQRWMESRSYSELGEMPMEAWQSQQAKDAIQEIVVPQTMTRENLAQFSKEMIGGVREVGGGLVRADIKYQAVVGEFAKLFSQEHKFRRPFFSHEEMQSLRRANVGEYERLERLGRPERQAYQQMFNAALASTGQYEQPSGTTKLTSARAAGLFGAATESARELAELGPEEQVPRRLVTGRMVEMMAQDPELAGKPIGIDIPGQKGLTLPSPEVMQRMRAGGQWENEEVSKALGRATQLLGRYGEGVEGEELNTLLEQTRSEFATVAQSESVRRRTIGTSLGSQAIGDVAHMSLALRPHEAYIPQLSEQRGGAIRKAVQAIRFPSRMTQAHEKEAGLALLSGREAERRGLNLSVAQFSPQMMQMMAGDNDGDKFLAYIRGDAVVDDTGNLIDKRNGSVLGNYQSIEKGALRAAAEGAATSWSQLASTKEGGGPQTPGQAKELINQMIQGRSVSTPEQLYEHFEKGSHMRSLIGQFYNPFRAVSTMMPEAAREPFERLWLTSHGRAQRPAPQLPGMQRLHAVMKSSLISKTGNLLRGARDPQERGFMQFEMGGGGLGGAVSESAYALRNLRSDKGQLMLGSAQYGTLFGGSRGAAGAIAGRYQQYQEALQGGVSGDRLKMIASRLSEQVLQQGMPEDASLEERMSTFAQSPMGLMMVPKWMKSAASKGEGLGWTLEQTASQLGVSPEFMEEQMGTRKTQEAVLTALGRGKQDVQITAEALERAGMGDWLSQKIPGAAGGGAQKPPEQPPTTTAARPEWEYVGPGGGPTPRRFTKQQTRVQAYEKGAPGADPTGKAQAAVQRIFQGRSPTEMAQASQEARRGGAASPLRQGMIEFVSQFPRGQRQEAMQAWEGAVGGAGISMYQTEEGFMVHDYAGTLAGAQAAVEPSGRADVAPTTLGEKAVAAAKAEIAGPGIDRPTGRQLDPATGMPMDPQQRAAEALQAGTPAPIWGAGQQLKGQGQPGMIAWDAGGNVWGRLGEKEMTVTEEHVAGLEALNKNLKAWDKVVAPAVEAGDQLTKSQIKLTSMIESQIKGADVEAIRKAKAVPLTQAAEAQQRIAGMEGMLGRVGITRGAITQQAFDEQLMAAQGGGAGAGGQPPWRGAAMFQRMFGEPGKGGYGRGVTGMAARGLGRLTSGWELMRLRRMWALTGGPVFGQQIPAAAEAGLAGWGAGVAIGGGAPGMAPGGVAGGLMQYQAQRRQSMIEAGRRGYMAYGAGMLPGVMEAGQQIQAVAGPAAGIGLLGGGLASTAMMAMGAPMGAAMTMALPVTAGLALGVGAIAGRQYTMGLAEPTAANQITQARFAEDVEGGQYQGVIGQVQKGFRRLGPALGAMFSGEIDPLASVSGPGGYHEWRKEQEQAGREALRTPFGDLGMGDRGAVLTDVAQQLRARGGVWANYDEGQIMQMLQSAAPFMPGMEDMSSQEILANMPPSLQIMAETGRGYEQYEPMAQQLRLGPSGAEDLLTKFGHMAAPVEREAMYRLGQYAPAAQLGGDWGRLLARQAVSPFEDEEARAATAERWRGVELTTGPDWLQEGVSKISKIAAFGTEQQPLAMERLSVEGQARMGRVIPGLERAQAFGADIPVPTDINEEWVQEQWRNLPQISAQTGLAESLFMRGAPSEQAWAATQAAADVGGIQGVRGLQGAISGDPSILNMLGQANVQGPFARIGETGMGMNVGQMRDAVAAGLEKVIPPQFMDSVMDGMDALKPLKDEMGRPMGQAAMYAGYAEGYDLPSTVDAGAFGALTAGVEAGGQRFLRTQQVEATQGYQDFQMRQQRERLSLQGVAQFGGEFTSRYSGETLQTRGTFAIQSELRNLSRIWEDFTSDYNNQQRELGHRQFMENWEVRSGRMPQQFQWQREDLAHQGQQAAIGFGWQMEDIQENLRFATGRDRRRLLRQQERGAIQYGMGEGRRETMGERIDVRQRWAREDLDREKRHAQERMGLQDQYQSQYRRYIEERRRLEDEMQQIREFQARFSMDAANEQINRQTELIEQQRAIQEQYNAINVSLQESAAKQANWVTMVQWLVAQAGEGGTLRTAFEGMVNDWTSQMSSASVYVSQPRSGGGSKR